MELDPTCSVRGLETANWSETAEDVFWFITYLDLLHFWEQIIRNKSNICVPKEQICHFNRNLFLT